MRAALRMRQRLAVNLPGLNPHGEFPGMAAERCKLDDLLSSVSPDTMDSPCTDGHLKKLGLELSNWRVVAMLLGLKDSEIEDIQEKGKSTAERGIMMLRKWRQSRGEQATYRWEYTEILIITGRV